MATPVPAVPPVPYKVPISTDDGFLVDAWGKFFRQLYERVGGAVALSNLQLQTIQDSELGTIDSRLTSLESRMTAAEASLAGGGLDFNQGPVL